MGTKTYELLLKRGHLIDPKNNLDGHFDVAILNGRVAAVSKDLDPALARHVIDLDGYYVTLGLLDIHVHVYHTRAPQGEPEGLSVVADAHSFRSGVTTVVDTGTSGQRHFLHFKSTCIDRQKTRILAFINICDQGMLGDFEQDPQTFDPELAAATVLAYPDLCVGGSRPPIIGHVTLGMHCTHHGRRWMRALLPWHCASGRSWSIFGRGRQSAVIKNSFFRNCAQVISIRTFLRSNFLFLALTASRVHSCLKHESAAWYLILATGKGSFWYRNAAPAMAAGFSSDSISTDLHTGNVHGTVVDMITTMSKMLNLGMPLQEVIYRSTVTPANEIGHPELGNLSIGACADFAVIKQLQGKFTFHDCGRARAHGSFKLENAMTIRAGEIVYDISGLSMPDWQNAPAAYFKTPDLQA